jgi:hypothetical protein
MVDLQMGSSIKKSSRVWKGWKPSATRDKMTSQGSSKYEVIQGAQMQDGTGVSGKYPTALQYIK